MEIIVCSKVCNGNVIGADVNKKFSACYGLFSQNLFLVDFLGFLNGYVTLPKSHIFGDEYYVLMKRFWKESYKETRKEHSL